MSDFEKYDGYLSRGGQIHILPGCNDAEIMPPREEPRDFWNTKPFKNQTLLTNLWKEQTKLLLSQ